MIQPTILQGDCRQTLQTLPPESVHCVVTSPPYWGLRSYLPVGHPLKHLEIGSEPTFALYLEHIVEVFEQVKRVLREDGVAWVNVGDAYAQDGKGGQTGGKQAYRVDSVREGREKRSTGLPGKNLLMMPARVAMALQDAGWYLRAMLPWLKRNAMPESVTDRPAQAVEYVFLLSKSERYFYDRYAVMRQSSDRTHPRTGRDGSFTGNGAVDAMRASKRGLNPKTNGAEPGVKQNESFSAGCSQYVVGQRNFRNSDLFFDGGQGLVCDDDREPIALVVNPVGTKIKHYATYPPKLIEPLIMASTSEKGCCPKCGAQWERIVSITRTFESGSGKSGNLPTGKNGEHLQGGGETLDVRRGPVVHPQTTGWKPGCDCDAGEPVPCTVLDPFSGVGTTGAVATRLGRRSILCELNPEYADVGSSVNGEAALL